MIGRSGSESSRTVQSKVNMAKSWEVGQLVCVPAQGRGCRVWRVVGIFLGAVNQEDVIELETMDLDRNTQGRMCVPRELLNAAMGAFSL